MDINLARFDGPKQEQPAYSIGLVTWTQDHRLWPDKLVWLADDERLEMDTAISCLSDVEGGRRIWYVESVVCVALPEQLTRLAQAHSLCLRVYGKGGHSDEVCLNTESMAALRRFVRECM